MAKKKAKDYGYDTLSALHGIIHRDSHKFLDFSNTRTLDNLAPVWIKNMGKNQKNRMWKKHGSFVRACHTLGRDKAIIAVGSGPSLNKNSDVLKFIHDNDSVRNWEDRNFIIFSSNHQFKPLLKMGVIPDFVYLVDASDVVYKQLCEDIPENGKSCILVAPYHADPKVLKEWTRQGRGVLFFLSHGSRMKEAFRKTVKKNPTPHTIVAGGNVLNTMWMFGAKIFQSKVFMCIGNDLSFPIKKVKKDQERGYYADGDYSTNAPGTGTGRDEAACEKKWLSFKIQNRNIYIPGQNELEVVGADVVGTSHTLWVYKTWMEESMLLITHAKKDLGLHYYNCTEGGILGVMAKSLDEPEMKKDSNWYMMDEVCKRWHTTTLEHAATQFLQAKEKIRWEKVGTLIGVQDAIKSVHPN
uniref:6-hydroxymethylpterin diphosphokinase MptE-like domain-containing protein n=1 Tax=viral metagenome TaxID=1070528 RepID=A0A6H1ZFK0_9ZZZZ